MPKVGINMQTIPPAMRPFCLVDKGYIGINQDLAQAENRIVAWTGPDLAMKQAFLDGIDIHKYTYSRMFEVPYESVSDELGSSDFGDGTKSQRFWGKQCNHSLNYDLSYIGFGVRYEVSNNQAKDLIERYHASYPGVRGSYQKMIIDELNKTRIIYNPYGRRRSFLGRLDAGTYREAYAHLPSSTVADHINISALLPLWEDQVFAETELLLQVHDSVFYQIPAKVGFLKIAVIITTLRDIMEWPIPFKEPFSIPTDTEVGFNYGKKTDKNPRGLRSLELGTIEKVAEELEFIWRENEAK